jgi:hypothetical protein
MTFNSFIFVIVPSVAPNNIEVTVYSSTRIGLVWDAIKASQANGILLGYNVSLSWHDKIGNQAQWSNRTALPTGNSVMITLEDLQKYTQHTFKVCGFTSKGCGPWSQDVTVRTHIDGMLNISRVALPNVMLCSAMQLHLC